MSITYADSGVDRDKGDLFVKRIEKMVRTTYNKAVKDDGKLIGRRPVLGLGHLGGDRTERLRPGTVEVKADLPACTVLAEVRRCGVDLRSGNSHRTQQVLRLAVLVTRHGVVVIAVFGTNVLLVRVTAVELGELLLQLGARLTC